MLDLRISPFCVFCMTLTLYTFYYSLPLSMRVSSELLCTMSPYVKILLNEILVGHYQSSSSAKSEVEEI